MRDPESRWEALQSRHYSFPTPGCQLQSWVSSLDRLDRLNQGHRTHAFMPSVGLFHESGPVCWVRSLSFGVALASFRETGLGGWVRSWGSSDPLGPFFEFCNCCEPGSSIVTSFLPKAGS